MTISNEIDNIKNNITNAYTVCNNKGVSLPQNKNCVNLAPCINNIVVGSLNDLKSILKQAWGWAGEGLGKAYFVHYKEDSKTHELVGFGNFKTLVKNFSTNYSGGFTSYILDGDFYYRNTSTNNYIKCSCNITDWIAYSSIGLSGLAIRQDGSLYHYTLSSDGTATLVLIDDTGIWTKLATYYSYIGTYGIRDGQLCLINVNQKTYTVIDDTGIWTDICGLSYGVNGFGIKDGQAYVVKISDGSSVLLGNETGFTAVSGSDSGLGICNGALYYLSGTSKRLNLLDDTQTWIKIAGFDMAITSTGKLYRAFSSSITQIGTDTGWTDICGQSSGSSIGLNNGNVYYNLTTTSNLKQITFEGDITQIDGHISTMAEVDRTCAVMVSNNPTNKYILTCAYPDSDSVIYFDENLTSGFKYPINSVDSNFEYIETTLKINGNYIKYFRNSTLDTNFLQTPEQNTRIENLINKLEGN